MSRHRRCVGCVDAEREEPIIILGEPYVIGADDRGTGSFHLACYLEGECFADLRPRVLWAMRQLELALLTFLTEYPKDDMRALAAAGFADELAVPSLRLTDCFNLIRAAAEASSLTKKT